MTTQGTARSDQQRRADARALIDRVGLFDLRVDSYIWTRTLG